jgi:hypothetical protein
VILKITGVNFSSPASVQFTPGSGIAVQSTTVTNSNELQVQMAIAPNASLGARGVVVVLGGKTRIPASNTFTVVSGASLSHALPVQILRVVPNQIVAGSQNVDLTLQGINFVPGTQVTFTVGAGVPAAVFANGPARYVNSTELHVSVNALPSALPGGRDIQLETPSRLSVMGKGMLNVLATKPSGLPTVMKIPPITLQNVPLGVIKLDAPLGAATSSDQSVTYGVPWLDDTAVFKWHEQNPGLADYYELRVYAHDGKTLLATQKISGIKVLALGGSLTVVPTYYRPDDTFIKEVLEPVRHPVLSSAANLRLGGNQQSGSASSASGNPNANTAPDQLSGELSQGDLQWEVAGFHTYNKNGVAPQSGSQAIAMKSGQIASLAQTSNALQNSANTQSSGETVDLEVEISNRWPLKAPQGPTGLACNNTGSTLQVQNLSAIGNDPNNYAGDTWGLGGLIDLSKSTYQSNFTVQTAVPLGATCGNQCLVKNVASVQFDNVFVDWGDGTVQPLSAPPQNPNLGNWDPRNPQEPLYLPLNSASPMQHTYNSPGSFTIRVFQLPEADLQHLNLASVSASVDGPTTPFMQTALLTKLAAQGAAKSGSFTQASVQSNFQQILAQANSSSAQSSQPAPQGPSPAQVASDAYMIYCLTVYLTVPEDLAATGPLHLMSIGDPDFGAYAVDARRLPVGRLGDRSGLSNSAGNEKQAANIGQPIQPEPAKGTQKTPVKLGVNPLRPSGAPAAAICSTCDDGMDATSYLMYYGTGLVRVTWTVDGTPSQQTISIPPSEKRKNLKRQGYTTIQIGPFTVPIPVPEPPIIVSKSKPIDSPGLQVESLGDHTVEVQADVLPQPTIPNLSGAVQRALGSLVPTSMSPSSGTSANNSGGKQASPALNVAEAQSLLNTLAAPAGSNLPPLKIGVLSPANQSSAGLGAVQYVNGPLQQVISQVASSAPDQHVASNSKVYEVVASDPKKPCNFLFPVKSGGAFEISGLQSGVTQQGTTYNGTGNLIIYMANAGSGGYDEYPPIPVKIDNWSVPDGLHVQTGTINVSPNLTLGAGLPSLQGTLASLSGQAGGELDATLNVTLSDDTLRLPGEEPVSWNGVTAELHSNGDWMKDGLALPNTLIGWSGFTMQSSSVRLDLSHHDGDAAGPYCGNLKGGDWVGVRFPSLTITPYTMDLVSTSSLQSTVTDWGVVGAICGGLTTKPFTATLGAGSVSFTSLVATTANGLFLATYKDMDIHVPWIDIHIKGDGVLQSGGGKQATINFPSASGSASKTYGNFAITANNMQFTQVPGIGWAVASNTAHFVFSAENKPFASFDLPFDFGMDGRGYFAQGAQSKDISLGGSSHLGQTPVDLASVHLTAPLTGSQVLVALFSANVHLSEVMAAAPVQVNYSIENSGSSYSTAGPTYAPFTIDVPFPSGQPSSEAKISPVYSGTSGSEYSGKVDLSELGGPPITGEFRLGYQGGHDYWLARVAYDFGPTGVPLVPVPPVMNLYRVQGGLGHNFPISAFKDSGSLGSATPVFDNSLLFMAGMRVGMPDQFTYTLDGDLVIKTTGQNAGARMDFHAWLVKMADSGNGDFQGYFQYAGSNFDGRLWGHLDFMSGLASVDLGNSENNAAVDLHIGSGPWHIDAGKQQGPRITGHLLIADANMYVMLSDAGLAMGGGESISLNVGDDSVASAYVRGDVDIGLAITPQPHISGDFSANVEAGVCVDDVCVSAGVSAQVHAEALPVEMNASASIGLPWPLGSVSFSVHM